MDIATFFGIFIGFSLVIGAIFLGGAVDIFINIPGMMIVLGGTFASTCVNFPISDILKALKAGFHIFTRKKVTPNQVVNSMVRIAEISRREGLLALEHVETDNKVLKKACQLIADNADANLITETLKIEIASLKNRHSIIQDVFKKMGNYAPAFGMIGTLIGLVQMLTKLEDPAAIGPAMAVAILTTFYGAIMANLLFLPIAGKLKSRTLEEILHLNIIFEGAKSILENNNPTFVYEKLSSFVAPGERKYDRR
ncbi:chemotaxis protein MotA [Desulfonauticus submarinus]|uniref:Chemotaxis protein MotA n=1 Tax=Desulfonauticus submarinus TaxID=206665 RepID=A0A1H0F289_9BACT|nr:MotA/TolQ/ExbB proton channel family protein [Desulfonauticus submarinus]SDN88659.1 chemotaxis protein MotA [Desulfonauticus submarinus]